MKIKHQNHKNFGFLKTNLLSLKLNDRNNLNSVRSVELKIKQVLKIIFEFHKFNKNIVFVGFPNVSRHKFSLLFNLLNYKFLNDKVWVNGLLTNSNYISTYLGSKRLFRLLKKENIIFLQKFNNFDKKPDIIVIFNRINNSKLVKEACKLKIPIVSFLNNSNDSSLISSVFQYNNHHKNDLLIRFIYFLLSSILLRGFKTRIR